MKLRTVLKVIGALVCAFVLWFGTYLAMLGWQTHKINSFCADIHPGMPVSSLTGIAEKHGIDQREVSGSGYFSERTKDWSFLITNIATMGETGCKVHHDGKNITFAQTYP